MQNKNYELIEHTADIGIKLEAESLEAIFKNSALAVFDIIAEAKSHKPSRTETIKIIQKAEDIEELFINWLNELLSLSSAKELVFVNFKFNKLSENELEAEAEAVRDYTIKSEIKAATYHELEIKKTGSGWGAKVIFDV